MKFVKPSSYTEDGKVVIIRDGAEVWRERLLASTGATRSIFRNAGGTGEPDVQASQFLDNAWHWAGAAEKMLNEGRTMAQVVQSIPYGADVYLSHLRFCWWHWRRLETAVADVGYARIRALVAQKFKAVRSMAEMMVQLRALASRRHKHPRDADCALRGQSYSWVWADEFDGSDPARLLAYRLDRTVAASPQIRGSVEQQAAHISDAMRYQAHGVAGMDDAAWRDFNGRSGVAARRGANLAERRVRSGVTVRRDEAAGQTLIVIHGLWVGLSDAMLWPLPAELRVSKAVEWVEYYCARAPEPMMLTRQDISAIKAELATLSYFGGRPYGDDIETT